MLGGNSKDGVLQVAFAPDNKTLYASGFDKYLHVWNTADGKEIKALGPTPDDLHGLAVSKDGKIIVTAGYGGNLRVWDVAGEKAKEFQLQDGKKKKMITYCITVTPDDKAVVTGHEAGNAAPITPLDKFVEVKVEKKKEEKKVDKKDDKKKDDKKKDDKKDKTSSAAPLPNLAAQCVCVLLRRDIETAACGLALRKC